MPPLWRCHLIALCVEMATETKVEAGSEQLGGKGWFSPKTVDGPARGGPQFFMKTQKNIERLDAMNGDGKVGGLCELHLANKPLFLHGLVSASQTVNAAFSHRHHRGMTQQLLQALKKGMYIGACRPPRMNAGRIEAARLKREGGRTQQGIFWQIDDSLVCRSMEVMGMEIHFHKSFSTTDLKNKNAARQGTGSYPLPPQGWQRRMRRTASHNPLKGPCFWMASTAYCEQVGVKRQAGGVSGEIYRW